MRRSPLGYLFEALNRFSESELAERHGLRDVAQRLIYRGTRTGVQAGTYARSRFREIQDLLPGERLQTEEAPKDGADLFDLTPTEEQLMTRETVRRFAAETVRPLANEGRDDGLREHVADLGLNLISIPEALGGVATKRSPLSTALIAEDLAHGDMGLALAALAPCGFINLVSEFGSNAQQGRYLPPMCSEEFVDASLALMEPRARFDPHRLETRARHDGSGFRLDGVKCMVPLAETAEVFIVFAELDGEGPHAFIVEAGTPGVSRAREPHMGLAAAGLGRLTLEGVRLEAAALLGAREQTYDHTKAVDLARLGVCALAVGTSQAVLDYVIEYCNDRVAFGEPISNRQAVAFAIADIAIEVESMRLLTYRAAARAERGRSFHREAYLARTLCAEKSMQIGSMGVQLLGGHGYVCEHPVERWYRQLRATGIMEGGLAL